MRSRFDELWDQLRTAFHSFVRSTRQGAKQQRYRLVVCATRNDAQAAAQSRRIVAVFSSDGKLKWAYLQCPCGCGTQLALNLMPSQRPVWRITMRSETDFAIFPSIDSTTCGAHFWLRSGHVTWSV
jgi:hypothetical protein